MKIKAEQVFLIIVLFSASFLFLLNLGNQYLWQDEAQTALVSKTILTHGIPLGRDYKNFFSQELGAEYGKNYIWKWHTWFPFYLVAAFFKIFGVNTFSARLPFALFGIATVFLTYFFTKLLWKSKRTAIVATILLLLSIPFLILSRQCRYYSPATFFSLLGLYSYLNLLENKKYASIVFLLSSTLLFHIHYLYCATLLLTVFIHALICYTNKLRPVLILLTGVILINFPWVIWLSTMKYGERYTFPFLKQAQFPTFAQAYLYHIEKNIFPRFLLLVPLLVGGFNWLKTKCILPKNTIMWRNLFLLLLFSIFNIIALSQFSPYPFFRYLAPLIPVLLIISALILNSAIGAHPVIGICLALILFFPRAFLNYLYEITHDYNGPIEGIAKYLNQNGSKNDTVAITYGDLPLKFYTDMRIIGGLTGEDLFPSKEADWVIVRKYLVCEKDYKVREYLFQNVPWQKYHKIIIDYPDTPFENRESPEEHNYRTVTNEDKVIIYQRIRSSSS